jgi:plastocyanin
MERRAFLVAATAAVAGLALPSRAATAATIRMMSTPDGSDVWFDPIGLWLPAGARVTWSNGADQANTHTATAYHPANGKHSLRIPEAARPWDSGYLLPGKSFTVTLTAEGVYDYFCQPHEMAGMVGRIVVGRPGGPGAQPFDWFTANHPDWQTVPQEAQRAFPTVEAVLRDKVVRR